MPAIAVAGVRCGDPMMSPDKDGIESATVQDSAGKLYDIYASNTEVGRKRLKARVRAATTLAAAREPNGLGFAMDRVLAFDPGENDTATDGTAVMIAMHQDGDVRPLELLTLDDCAAIGTAIGAIHRLNPSFLAEAKYPTFTTGQIRAQLVSWIKRLRQAGHVPGEITSSWSRIVDAPGLWSFSTCFVHGGFDDGDVRFAGSTVTAINNWHAMQVNDPARDLGWVYSKLDDDHRNAVITAYGRMMGNRLDDMIMLRANLWVQMEQVGDFIQALNHADTDRIMKFKAQVDRLAHQLGVANADAGASGAQASSEDSSRTGASAQAGDLASPPSTITVGTLLKEDGRHTSQGDDPRKAATSAPTEAASAVSPASGQTGQTRQANEAGDDTVDPDQTGSSQIAIRQATAETIAISRSVGDTAGSSNWDDATADRQPVASPTVDGGSVEAEAGDANASTDDTAERPAGHYAGSDAETTAIPLLEREERALRDAQEGIDMTDKGDK